MVAYQLNSWRERNIRPVGLRKSLYYFTTSCFTYKVTNQSASSIVERMLYATKILNVSTI